MKFPKDKQIWLDNIKELSSLSQNELVEKRYNKFRSIGEFLEE